MPERGSRDAALLSLLSMLLISHANKDTFFPPHSNNSLPPPHTHTASLLSFDNEKEKVRALNPVPLSRAGLLSLLHAQFALSPISAAELAGDSH